MRVIFLSLFVYIISFTAAAQKGSYFPDIAVTDLNEQESEIPKDTKGKFTLVGIAFSEDAQSDLYSWSQPVYNKFIDRNNLSSMVYDPNVKLILMFGGGNQIVYNKAKKQIAEGTDRSLKDNVVLYKGSVKEYRKKLNMKNRKIPYFFVLDEKGKIIYTAQGRYNSKTIEKVADLIEL